MIMGGWGLSLYPRDPSWRAPENLVKNQVRDQTEVQLEEYHSWSQGSRDRPAPKDRTTSLLQDFMECTETARFPVPDGFRQRQFYSFRYQTDRTPYSSAFQHFKAFYEGGEGYTLHVYSILLAEDRDTPCTPALLMMDRDTPCTSTLMMV